MSENNETVLVGQSDSKGKLTRRDFLKASGAAIGSLFLAACGINVPESTGSVVFREVEDGQTINLTLRGELTSSPVVIHYPQHGLDFTPLQIRQDNGHDTVQPFTPGQLMTRKMGELTSQQIFRVVANPDLKGTDIHTYPSAVTESGSQGMGVLDPRQEYDALIVITVASDYMQNGTPVPLELNGHPIGSRPVESFGVGALLGGVSMIDGKQTFVGDKLIHDLRAVSPAPVK